MQIDIITLFPEMVTSALGVSIIGRAQAAGLVRVSAWQLRDYTRNKQKQVDDYPYGGGQGMVLAAQPLLSAWADVRAHTGFGKVHTVLLSAAGKPYTQQDARRLQTYGHIMLVCGHYEGVDERFAELCADEELSVGDFVQTGGEIPAMAIADSVCRLVPGVLSEAACFTDESHWDGLLEYPHYTRPEVWEGRSVPPVLVSGDHARVAEWRDYQSVARTMLRRPDLWMRRRKDAEL